MVEVMVLFAGLTLIGGVAYSFSVWFDPLATLGGQLTLIGSVVAGVFWMALAAILGNQRRILSELEELRRGRGAAAPGVEPTPVGAGEPHGGPRVVQGE